MGASQLREELHKLINSADENTLYKVYDLIQAQKTDNSLTEKQREDLNQRIKNHNSGKSESYTWAEARLKVEKRA